MKNNRILLKILSAAILLCVILFAFASCGDDEAQDNADNNGSGENGGSSGSADPEPKSFLKKAETGDRNNYGGSVGYEISVLADMQVTAVGRPVSGEMNQAHTIYIWEVSSQNLLASAEVTPDSPIDSLGFKTAQLSSPVILKAGEFYRIVSAEFVDGDMWYDVGTAADDPIPDLQPNDEAMITTPVFTGEGADEQGSYPANEWNPGGIRGYVGVTFYYVPVTE